MDELLAILVVIALTGGAASIAVLREVWLDRKAAREANPDGMRDAVTRWGMITETISAIAQLAVGAVFILLVAVDPGATRAAALRILTVVAVVGLSARSWYDLIQRRRLKARAEDAP